MVVFVDRVLRCMWSARQSIRRGVVLAWYMLQFEVEKEYTRDPSINCRTGLNIRVINHPFDILCVDFDGKILYTDDKELDRFKRSK